MCPGVARRDYIFYVSATITMGKSLGTAAAESQRTRPSSTHSAVINTLEGNVRIFENRYFVADDAVDIVPDDSTHPAGIRRRLWPVNVYGPVVLYSRQEIGCWPPSMS
jgi:hypothetical protein